MRLNPLLSNSLPLRIERIKRIKQPLQFVVAGVCLLLLAGCVTTPANLQSPSSDSPGVQQVRANAEANLNKSVRWGGTIVGVQNLQGETRIEVIGKPLFRNGQPDSREVSQGRFIAVFDKFLDPADYKKDSAITIVGVVTGTELGKVGEAEYDFPRVQATASQLWQRQNSRFARRSEYGYGPAYGPVGFHHHGYARGYGRYSYGSRYHHNSAFYDWWIPGLVWSIYGNHRLYGNHRGRHRGSRVGININLRN